MLLNYFKISFRNLLKKKAYSFINIAGLAVGIACCITILLYVQFEFSYDTFHEHSDRIYRVQRSHSGSGGPREYRAPVNYALAPILKENFPQAEQVVRLAKMEEKVTVENAVFMEPRFFYADPSVFEVFSIKTLIGNPETALSQPMSMVLTKRTAQKYFGTQNPVGEFITVDDEKVFTVTGVVEELPDNSHFHFDFLASLESTRNWLPDVMYEQWGNLWNYTYLLMEEGAEVEEFQRQLNPTIAKFSPPALEQFEAKFYLLPMEDIHLYSQTPSEIEAGGNALFVYVFMAVAVLVLAIACFNFINLTTARSSWRAREVGMRKVLGAHRGNLIRQFIGESLLVAFFGLLLAILLVELALPYLNEFLDKNLILNLFEEPSIMVSMFLILLTVGLLAGSYPAFVLSSFSTSKVLKGRISPGDQAGGDTLRNGLVIFQFTISTVLIVGTIVVYSQLQFIKNRNLGFDKEQIAIIKINQSSKINQQLDLVKQRFERHSNVLGVSASSDAIPTALNSWRVYVSGRPADSYELLNVLAVDDEFFEVLDIPFVSGRSFSIERGTDQAEAVILNEKAVEHFRFSNPLNESLVFYEQAYSIIGVAKNFHYNSLHDDIEPVAFVFYPDWFDNLYVKVAPEDISATISSLEQDWNAAFPSWPFEFHFLDDAFNQQYRAEEKLGQLIGVFSVLAIFVACLGLFGLASFTTEQRFKEIGIRKVLGASISSILGLLSIRYLYLMLISFAVAVPVSYFAMNSWLQGFSYKVAISPTVFLVAVLIIATIALLTVSYQAIKAARMNPIDSLRSE